MEAMFLELCFAGWIGLKYRMSFNKLLVKSGAQIKDYNFSLDVTDQNLSLRYSSVSFSLICHVTHVWAYFSCDCLDIFKLTLRDYFKTSPLLF